MESQASQRENKGGLSASLKPAKFAVYQNSAFSVALTATSLRPSTSSFLLLFALSSASAFALLAFSSRESSITKKFRVMNVSEEVAYLFTKVVEVLVGVAFIGASASLVRAIILRTKIMTGVVATCASKRNKNETCLSDQQLRLLGVQRKPDKVVLEPSRKPPISKPQAPASSSDALIPLHHTTTTSRPSRIGSDNSSTTTPKSKSFVAPSMSPKSPATYLVSPASSHFPSVQTSPGFDQSASTPWSNKRASPAKEIITEEELENFLADVDKKITESAEKLATPPTGNSFSPSTISGSANTSGTTRTTPLRPVRMSPGSQKYSTPPKKGEGDTASPMSMEESIEAFEHLRIYPQIEEWRDRLRQWFSSVLLSPLLSKIENSHIKVMQAAAEIGISITLSPIGSGSSDAGAPTLCPMDRSKEWLPAFTPDEDGLLHQLRAYLMQALEASTQRLTLANQQQSPQQNAYLHIMQECVDAITERQRLLALTKGELIRGLLPQSSVPAEYAVQRIKELAEGTCLKNYEYMQCEDASDKVKTKWILELPSDSHLLLYLFCAFLEYPNWMLHVDPSAYSGAQSSKNPLFLGILPPKERFPEKYVAVVSFVPSILHPGACILVVGKQNPPIFALYWDKKLLFCLQGRTSLWDSILLLCYKIKTAYGGFVRGIHLGSSALNILAVLESEEED